MMVNCAAHMQCKLGVKQTEEFTFWPPCTYEDFLNILVLIFRALHGQAPNYMLKILKPLSLSMTLRASNQMLFAVPRTHFKTFGNRAFQVVAHRFWNGLPLSFPARTPLIISSEDIFSQTGF